MKPFIVVAILALCVGSAHAQSWAPPTQSPARTGFHHRHHPPLSPVLFRLAQMEQRHFAEQALAELTHQDVAAVQKEMRTTPLPQVLAAHGISRDQFRQTLEKKLNALIEQAQTQGTISAREAKCLQQISQRRGRGHRGNWQAPQPQQQPPQQPQGEY